MSRRNTRRHQPYDLNNPANWTVNKLKLEIEKLGIKITPAISKSALLQIYNQLMSKNVVNIPQNTVSDTELNTVEEAPTEREHEVTMVNSVPSGNTDSSMLSNQMGLMASVQQTITTLQCTVNKLLDEKQSKGQSSTNTNMLEKIYKGNSSSAVNPPQTTTQGIPADELPHIDIISDSIRRNITDGKYVNLASLLLPEFDTPYFTSNDLSGLELLRQSRRDHRLDRPLSISQFLKAFGIYKRIMCEAFPQRRLELDLYEADIGNIFQYYGDIFYQYHVQFSKKAAAYLEKGIKVDWSKRNKDLFQLLVGGVKTKTCDHCSQSDHESPFCPSQINVSGVTVAKKSDSLKGSTKYDPNFDKHGRTKMTNLGTIFSYSIYFSYLKIFFGEFNSIFTNSF